jgi:hypothetical protein
VDARHKAGHDEFRQQVCAASPRTARIAEAARANEKGGSQNAAAQHHCSAK